MRTCIRAMLTAFVMSAAMASSRLAQQPKLPASRTPLANGVTAIVSVTVIPMTRDTVLRNSTVVIRNGRIAEIGSSMRVAIPRDATLIDGAGKFLIPGLADVHAHLYSDDEVADSLAHYELGVMLANGITSARLMIGTPEQLTLRSDVMSGRVTGPGLWLASPQFTVSQGLNSRVVGGADDARAAVRETVAAGYDFIKLIDVSGVDVYDALVAEARRLGIPIDGHVDPRIGVARALAAGQHIQHLDSYLEAALADSAAGRPSLTQGGAYRLQQWKSMDWIDDRKIAALGGATARAGIWSTPTLTIFNKAFAVGFTDEELRARPDWELMPPRHRALYMRARDRYWQPANDSVRTPERRAKYVAVRNALAKAIMDSGGRVLAGSDAPDLLMTYGWTLHRELESLVQAGLTPWQALLTATRNPAEFFGAAKEWGTIAAGRRADLVLLDADPLSDIRNTTSISAVSIGGRWFSRQQLDAMVRDAKSKINGF
jgi:imidazolonepropionase-like amidohydrolase